MTSARLAGFATRGLGLVVDLVILNLSVLVVGGAVGWAGNALGVELSASTRVVVGLAAAGWLLLVSSYLVVFWSLTGQTPGMRFMGIQVTDRRGVPPSTARSLRRLLGFYLAALPAGAGFLLVLVDDHRRGLHDRVAGTLVIHDPAAAPSRSPGATAPERESVTT